jgi:hypothetical protein
VIDTRAVDLLNGIVLILSGTVLSGRAGEWPADHPTRCLGKVLRRTLRRILVLSGRRCGTRKDALERRRSGMGFFGKDSGVINEWLWGSRGVSDVKGLADQMAELLHRESKLSGHGGR